MSISLIGIPNTIKMFHFQNDIGIGFQGGIKRNPKQSGISNKILKLNKILLFPISSHMH